MERATVGTRRWTGAAVRPVYDSEAGKPLLGPANRPAGDAGTADRAGALRRALSAQGPVRVDLGGRTVRIDAPLAVGPGAAAVLICNGTIAADPDRNWAGGPLLDAAGGALTLDRVTLDGAGRADGAVLKHGAVRDSVLLAPRRTGLHATGALAVERSQIFGARGDAEAVGVVAGPGSAPAPYAAGRPAARRRTARVSLAHRRVSFLAARRRADGAGSAGCGRGVDRSLPLRYRRHRAGA